MNNQPYQLPVHLSLVAVYAVELVFQNNRRQGVVEELPWEKRHDLFKGGFDVSCSFYNKQMEND